MNFRFPIFDFRLRAGFAALLLLPTVSPGAEPDNLLGNGGFEKSIEVNLSKDNPQYKPLLERQVALPTGEKVPMPAQVYINPADGWVGAGCKFEYVEGKPGAEVHTGARAVRIESPDGFSAFSMVDRISVVEGVGLDDRAVTVGVPVKFSFWARGNGAIRVNCYLYSQKHENLYDYARLLTVEPGQFAVEAGAPWKKFEGTLVVRDASVSYFGFVIAVQGQVVLDDMALFPR